MELFKEEEEEEKEKNWELSRFFAKSHRNRIITLFTLLLLSVWVHATDYFQIDTLTKINKKELLDICTVIITFHTGMQLWRRFAYFCWCP